MNDPGRSTRATEAFLWGWLSCGVLDLAAACLQAWWQAGRTPVQVLQGVASALWGAKAVTAGGAGLAAAGLLMHFTVAFGATLAFALLSRRIAWLRTGPLWAVGALWGLAVFCTMNYATLPLLSWVRSLHLGTPARWPGAMGWPQVGIHLLCVGLPIVWGLRRAGPRT